MQRQLAQSNRSWNIPVDTRRRLNVYKTSYRSSNDVVCLLE